MKSFLNFLNESGGIHHDGDVSREQEVQDMLFGIQDNIPIFKDSLNESVENDPENKKRLIFMGKGHQSLAIGINVPRHMWEGTRKTVGMREINKKRAEVYGSENRAPLSKKEIHRAHISTLSEHFKKSIEEQKKAEKEALERLRRAGHIGHGSNTLDTSVKTDTAHHEQDEEGRYYSAVSSKGVAGHALYTSGVGKHEQHHIMNVCLGQTEGCGGGKKGIVDTRKGSCFAPNDESRYPNAAVRRACKSQAIHDPAMTRDWILAHLGSLRDHAEECDRTNKRALFRPNVVDETDTTSRFAIRGLNRQRKKDGKPTIIGNGYGKTGDIHDPENDWHSAYSNSGPKVKDGKPILDNIMRDNRRIRETIHVNNITDEDENGREHERELPAKNSYLVTNAGRNSILDKEFQQHVTHAKYWSQGRKSSELSDEERAQGDEGHYDKNGNPTTPELAHYGHKTINGRRYDYQKQHILHPRIVTTITNEPVKGSDGKSMRDSNGRVIKKTVVRHTPTDSRFKDNDYLPSEDERYVNPHGKLAGAILATSPTISTKGKRRNSDFTHKITKETIEHAKNNNGEFEIDKPEDQEKSMHTQHVVKLSPTLARLMNRHNKE